MLLANNIIDQETVTNVNYIIPREAPSYTKLPTFIVQWKQYLTGTQFNVLSYIITRIDKYFGYAYSSTKTAAYDCNICEKTFIKNAKLLEKLGLIFIDKSNKNNRYYLLPPSLPTLDLITKYLPKMRAKYIKFTEEKKLENQQLQFKFTKVAYIEDYRKQKANESETINNPENTESKTADPVDDTENIEKRTVDPKTDTIDRENKTDYPVNDTTNIKERTLELVDDTVNRENNPANPTNDTAKIENKTTNSEYPIRSKRQYKSNRLKQSKLENSSKANIVINDKTTSPLPTGNCPLSTSSQEKLKDMNISPPLIFDLAKKNEPSLIEDYVNYTYYCWQNNKVSNPSGFLKKAVTEKYDLSQYHLLLENETKRDKSKERTQQMLFNMSQESKQSKQSYKQTREIYDSLTEEERENFANKINNKTLELLSIETRAMIEIEKQLSQVGMEVS